MIIKNKYGFTLIEIMVGIIIVSIVLIGGFQALVSITAGKSKLIQETNIQKESFYFTEKLFEMIKKGGTLDYEEYFNRKVIGTNFSSGHYSRASGFGNFGQHGNVGSTTYGTGFYYCRSGDVSGGGDRVIDDGCYNNGLNNFGNYSQLTINQRYGQYSFQFRDYNSNADSDLGDEDGLHGIVGDDDDEYLGLGPSAFSGSTDLKELYLISGDRKKRTYFRWNVRRDPNAGNGINCSINGSNVITGSGCIGNIEYLSLVGKDWGMDHNLAADPDNTQGDGVIDTWIVDPFINNNAQVVAGSTDVNWIPLFPDTINVSEFEVFAYPNTDIDYNWRDDSNESNVAPYVVLKMKIEPSWISRRHIKGKGKVLEFSMTINLTDMYSK